MTKQLRMKPGDRVVYCTHKERGRIVRKMKNQGRQFPSGDWVVLWDYNGETATAFEQNLILESEYDKEAADA